MTELKLVALDGEDLEVLSAHLQDSVLRVGDMAYLPSQKRFACVANRFDWQGAQAKNKTQNDKFERRRAALRFERVLGAKIKNINLKANDSVLALLAIQYEMTDDPEGYINLFFAGGGTIRLHVECVEAEMQDLGAAWQTKNKPEHQEAGAQSDDEDKLSVK